MSDIPPLPPQFPQQPPLQSQPPAPQRHSPRQPDNSGNVLMVIFGGLALLLLLCGGGFFLFYWIALTGVRQVTTGVKNEINEIARDIQISEPAKIIDRAEAITAIDVPAGLQPKTAARIRIPFSDSSVMSTVVFTDENDKSSLMLAQFNDQFWDKNSQKQLKTQFDQKMQEQGHDREEVAEDIREETVRVIREHEAHFVLIRGRGKETGKDQIVLQGFFMGKGGPAFAAAVLDAEIYTIDDARAVIQSIR